MLCALHIEEARTFNVHLKGVSKYERLPLASLSVDRRFQRRRNDRIINNIKQQFNEYALGTLSVSRRAHENTLLDGQQRATALLEMSFAEAPCEVLEGLTFEQEVMIFVIRNQDRVQVPKVVLFKDKALARLTFYREAMEILTAHGFSVSDNAYRTKVERNKFSCPGAIEKVHAMNKLDDTLTVIERAFDRDPEANRAEFLLGIAAFLKLFGHIRPEDLADKLRSTSATAIRDQAKTVSKAHIERRIWVHAYEAIREFWNRGKRNDSSRLPRLDVSPNAPKIWYERSF